MTGKEKRNKPHNVQMRPERILNQNINEVYSNKIGCCMFDGAVVTVEFCAERASAPEETSQPGQPPKVSIVTVSRVAIRASAALDLLNKLKTVLNSGNLVNPTITNENKHSH